MKVATSKTVTIVTSLLAVVAFSVGTIWVLNTETEVKLDSLALKETRSRAEIQAAFLAHVEEAQSTALAAIEKRSAGFVSFIEFRKYGVGSFSKDIVSFYGKWRAVSPYLPFTDKNGHRRYVTEKFEAHIFSNEQLGAAVQRAVEGSLKDLESIENDLALALRKEILGRSLHAGEDSVAKKEFSRAIEKLVASSQWDAAKGVGSLVVSEVAAQVATRVLVRLGISAGILGAGAANSWWSFGGALVIGIVVDAIWEWVDNPAGDIEREMISALDELSHKASIAIKTELRRIVSNRVDLWSATIEEILP